MACIDMNRVINDKPVYVKQWSASKALENLSKALSVFGPKLGPFIEGDFLLVDITRLLSGDSKEILPLMKTFIAAARIDGKEILPAQFDEYYNGELLLVFKIFSFVCEVQYKDFFVEGLRLVDSRPEATQKSN
jgi:hypothetical protein